MALTTTREVLSWGHNTHGQLGHHHGTPPQTLHEMVEHPRAVEMDGTVDMIACGAYHSVALCLDGGGRVYGFGWGEKGQLGCGDGRSKSTPTAIKQPAEANTIVHIAAGDEHTILLDSSGRAYACGCGGNGRLGTGQDTNEMSPILLTTLLGAAISSSSCGAAHSLLLEGKGGQLYACGRNERGQLGLGDTVPRHWPVLVPLAAAVIVCVHAAGSTSVCETSDGSLLLLGQNTLTLFDGRHEEEAAARVVSAISLGVDGEAMAVVLEASSGDGDEVAAPAAEADVSEEQGNTAATSSSVELIHEGPVKVEAAGYYSSWIRGSAKQCMLQLCGEELRLVERANDESGSSSTLRVLPLSSLDGIGVVHGSKLRIKPMEGNEMILTCETASAAFEWKGRIQLARGVDSSPRRAFLQAAVGEAMLLKRKKPIPSTPLRAAAATRSGGEISRWLCLAASWGEVDEVSSMLRAGAHVDGTHSTSSSNRTPLHYAVLNGHTATVEVLLRHHADPNREDSEGIRPLESALELGYLEVGRRLAAYGAVLTSRAEGLIDGNGRLLAELREAQWQATRGVNLLGSPAAPGGGVRRSVRRSVEGEEWAVRAWRETLEAAPTPQGGGGGVEVVDVSDAATPTRAQRSSSPSTPHPPPSEAANLFDRRSTNLVEETTPAGPRFPTVTELRHLCEIGIPIELRHQAWPLLLSMRAPLLPTSSEYEDAKMIAINRMQIAAEVANGATVRTTGLSTEVMEADAKLYHLIGNDLDRTFPSTHLFTYPIGPYSHMLREVLWVYCTLPDSISYFQGLSHLAAVLLLHTNKPSTTCASLSALLSGYPLLRACGTREREQAHTRTHSCTHTPGTGQ